MANDEEKIPAAVWREEDVAIIDEVKPDSFIGGVAETPTAAATANTVLDNVLELSGDFNDFLRMLKSAEGAMLPDMEGFNPLISIEREDGTAIAEANKPGPDDTVVVMFVSGIPNKWYYREAMKWRDFLHWKLRAKKEAGFSFS